MLGGCLHHQHHHDEFPNTKQKPWNEMGRGPLILTFFFISFIESFFFRKMMMAKKKKNSLPAKLGFGIAHTINLEIYL